MFNATIGLSENALEKSCIFIEVDNNVFRALAVLEFFERLVIHREIRDSEHQTDWAVCSHGGSVSKGKLSGWNILECLSRAETAVSLGAAYGVRHPLDDSRGDSLVFFGR